MTPTAPDTDPSRVDGAPQAPPTAADGFAYHRIPRALPHRRHWFRPLVAVGVSGAVYVVMLIQLLVPLLLVTLIWPGAGPSEMLTDPLNPTDQLLGLGMLALLLPAVLIGTLAGYGRAGIAHSVFGRFRWRLLGRAAIVVLPVYVLLNMVLSLVLERDALVVPPFSAAVVLAWLVVLVLAPLQSAGEEYLFRVLPLQALGTWLRWPIVGILLPVPLFVLGHGYNLLGQIHIALFAIVMGLLAWKTGGIELPVLLHAANNWTLFAIAPLIPGFTEQGEVTVEAMIVATAPMLALVAGIWWWYSRREGLGLWEPQRGTLRSSR
ncbi:CPBP family intramembrane glutamic endopeptidase [Brachybacterium alimentarium]|uniref:CPBP family intramembrane glutamic endopeptidase n=1 Tax=Brachybacterium alimentarium TaxID=47845 RepID=UPI000DF151D4|nr:CPBP family intramembrane glutamic endopeptidase [Brachybacterium alimentarium]RCS83662.1 CPBP family intramembrane metalloprotease [Brachybacterium alimentarium]